MKILTGERRKSGIIGIKTTLYSCHIIGNATSSSLIKRRNSHWITNFINLLILGQTFHLVCLWILQHFWTNFIDYRWIQRHNERLMCIELVAQDEFIDGLLYHFMLVCTHIFSSVLHSTYFFGIVVEICWYFDWSRCNVVNLNNQRESIVLWF